MVMIVRMVRIVKRMGTMLARMITIVMRVVRIVIRIFMLMVWKEIEFATMVRVIIILRLVMRMIVLRMVGSATSLVKSEERNLDMISIYI